MKRGDIILVAAPGDFGKPRPAVVVQNEMFRGMESVTYCPLTSLVREEAEAVRVTLKPRKGNGLHDVSQVMVDKIGTVALKRVSATIGKLNEEELEEVSDALRLWLDLT